MRVSRSDQTTAFVLVCHGKSQRCTMWEIPWVFTQASGTLKFHCVKLRTVWMAGGYVGLERGISRKLRAPPLDLKCGSADLPQCLFRHGPRIPAIFFLSPSPDRKPQYRHRQNIHSVRPPHPIRPEQNTACSYQSAIHTEVPTALNNYIISHSKHVPPAPTAPAPPYPAPNNNSTINKDNNNPRPPRKQLPPKPPLSPAPAGRPASRVRAAPARRRGGPLLTQRRPILRLRFALIIIIILLLHLISTTPADDVAPRLLPVLEPRPTATATTSTRTGVGDGAAGPRGGHLQRRHPAGRAARVRGRQEPADGRGGRAQERAAPVGQRGRLELQRAGYRLLKLASSMHQCPGATRRGWELGGWCLPLFFRGC